MTFVRGPAAMNGRGRSTLMTAALARANSPDTSEAIATACRKIDFWRTEQNKRAASKFKGASKNSCTD